MMDSCSLSAFPIASAQSAAQPGADGKQKMNANAAAGVLVVEDVSHIPLDALQLLKLSHAMRRNWSPGLLRDAIQCRLPRFHHAFGGATRGDRETCNKRESI